MSRINLHKPASVISTTSYPHVGYPRLLFKQFPEDGYKVYEQRRSEKRDSIYTKHYAAGSGFTYHSSNPRSEIIYDSYRDRYPYATVKRPWMRCRIAVIIFFALLLICGLLGLTTYFIISNTGDNAANSTAVFSTTPVNVLEGRTPAPVPTVVTPPPSSGLNHTNVTEGTAQVFFVNQFATTPYNKAYTLFISLKNPTPIQADIDQRFTWAAVIGQVNPPPYVAFFDCANFFTGGCYTSRPKRNTVGGAEQSITYTVGADNGCDVKNVLQFCNGPLPPNSTFYVMLAGHDANNNIKTTPFYGPITTTGIVNECGTDPCQNGGSCTDLVGGFTCQCAAGYTGGICETDINECASTPCQNDGTCTDLVNGYNCTCGPGFTGTHCETDINECSSDPCQIPNVCTDKVNGFICTCIPGFTGTRCTINIDECVSTPCVNAGNCTDLVNSYNCTCRGGYTGVHCETEIKECTSDPCQNGASCTDIVNGYTCSCVDGFTGSHCETDINECASDPCLNGGNCTDVINGYYCNCTDGFTGTLCETGFDEYLVVFPRSLSVVQCSNDYFIVTLTDNGEGSRVDFYNTVSDNSGTIQLSSGGVERLIFPYTWYSYTQGNTILNGKLLHLTAFGKISVHLELPCIYVPYMYKLWPVTPEHTHFIGSVTQDKYFDVYGHDFIIVAKKDNTAVNIVDQLNQTVQLNLNTHQLYAYVTSDNRKVVELTSSSPVVVISLYRCVYPKATGSCDGAATQLTPVAQWSNENFVPVFQPGLVSVDVQLTAVSAVDGNNVTLDNGVAQVSFTLDRFKSAVFQSGIKPMSITCQFPCLVEALIPIFNDPDVTFIATPKNYSSNVLKFSSYDPDTLSMYFTLVAESSITSTLLLDGSNINSTWYSIPGQPYKYTNMAISSDKHTIIAEGKFTGYIMYRKIYWGLGRAIG